jgi:tetratricopeptide (TPR) repeat protein
MRLSLLILLSIAPTTALADGKRDLEDGIAFYENLDTDRAMERLTRATRATDLDAADKAKAFLYLGMLQFEIGSISDAKKSWTDALKLKRDIAVPEGTSPKTIEAIEEVRAKVAATPGGPKVEPPPPSYDPPPPPPLGGEEPPPTPPIDVAPPPPPPPPDEALVTETAPPPEGGTNTWLWVGIGAGAAVVVAVVIVVAVVVAKGGGNGSECDMGGGGCLGITFQ